jgi:hypothetical protein
MSCLDLLDSAVDKCLDDGFAFFPGLLNNEIIEQLRKELHPWLKRPAVGGAGYITVGGDHLLTDLGLYSREILHLAVDEKILDLLENIFGTSAVLTELSFRRRSTYCVEMPLHTDNGDGIIIYIYLNGVSFETGSTCVVPKTHEIGASMNEGYLQVPNTLVEKHHPELICPEGPAGSILVFDQNIWHMRSPVTVIGRELIWLTYHSAERAIKLANMKISCASLSGLSERQFRAVIPSSGNLKVNSEFFIFNN